MKLFINKTDNKKIELLDYLIRQPKEVTISELISVTGLSDKTIRAIIHDFPKNPALAPQNVVINYNEVGKIKSIGIINSSLVDIAFYYLEQSILYVMIKELFLNGNLQMEKFCEEHFISSSTFSRYKSKLKSILEQFNLKLLSNLALDGEEYRIRNFFFLFFSNANSKWLFSEEEYQAIDVSLKSEYFKDFSFDPAQQSMVRLLIYICKIRNSQGNTIQETLEITLKAGSSYEKIYDDTYHYIENHFSYFDYKEREAQFLFIFFLRNQMISPEPYSEDGLSVVIKSIENLKEAFEKSSQFLTDEIITHFFKDNEAISPMIYYKVSTFLLYAASSFCDSRSFLYIYDFDVYYSKTNYEQQIIEKVKLIIRKIVKQFPDNPFVVLVKDIDREEAFENQLFLLVYSLLSKQKKYKIIKVKVYVQNSKVYIADILKRQIKDMFLENVEIVDRYSEDIDVFVSDKEYMEENTTNKVYVPTFSDAHYLDAMFGAIASKVEATIGSQVL
ncbi:helix-turn-helix domain-containing protein [Enterococcus sp. 5H]|uniref:helix-turn-helix domain-containing protein n=1 Tax=Enterococcus sp. 5H TaxID=1229490 RepID=UPI002303C48D|nr:helix-turn-helix domain-containing protein [Enterococcus sp. 5H]